MWLYGNPPVMVVMMVMVSVWAKLARVKADSRLLLKHFHISGCQSNITTYQKVSLDYLRTKPRFLIGLGGTSRTTISLLAPSSLPCKLPPNVLFCALPSTKEKLLTIVFQQVVFEDDDSEQTLRKENRFGESDKMADNQVNDNAEHLRRNQTGNKERKESPQQNDVTCKFLVGDLLSLRSGYGFISCRDDPNAIKELWREWQEAVTTAEEEAARARINTVVGVVIGTCVILLLILVCVVCRLRSARPTPCYSRRRPSNTSGGVRTCSTNDHPSSRT